MKIGFIGLGIMGAPMAGHLRGGQALIDTLLPSGEQISAAALPIEFDGLKAGKRSDPAPIGGDTRAVLAGLGLDPARIEALLASGAVAAPPPQDA